MHTYTVTIRFRRSVRGLGYYNDYVVRAANEYDAGRRVRRMLEDRHPCNATTVVAVEDETAPQYVALYR